MIYKYYTFPDPDYRSETSPRCCLETGTVDNIESYMDFLFPTLLQLQIEQLSNSSDSKFCMPLASAILAGINMRFSHYLMFSDSTQTRSVALASMTHPAFKLRWIKPSNLEQIRDLFLNTLRLYLLGCTSNMLQSLDVLMKWKTPKLWSSLLVWLIVTESQEQRFNPKVNFRV